jgi:3-oxoacyl-[acyl-carrier protein] reductase
MQSLKGKNALITGAGKGIGKAVALALAEEGANVILVARTAADVEAVAKEAEAKGVKTLALAADVAEIISITTAIEKAVAEFGKIDILINNAGVGKFGKFMDLTPDEFEHIIKVNLMGTYYATRAVLPE